METRTPPLLDGGKTIVPVVCFPQWRTPAIATVTKLLSYVYRRVARSAVFPMRWLSEFIKHMHSQTSIFGGVFRRTPAGPSLFRLSDPPELRRGLRCCARGRAAKAREWVPLRRGRAPRAACATRPFVSSSKRRDGRRPCGRGEVRLQPAPPASLPKREPRARRRSALWARSRMARFSLPRRRDVSALRSIAFRRYSIAKE